MKKSSKEFLKVEWDSPTNKPSISGLSIDVFLAAQHALPFPLPHEFIPYMNKDRKSNGTYDEFLYQIKTQVGFFLIIYLFIYIFFLTLGK